MTYHKPDTADSHRYFPEFQRKLDDVPQGLWMIAGSLPDIDGFEKETVFVDQSLKGIFATPNATPGLIIICCQSMTSYMALHDCEYHVIVSIHYVSFIPTF